MPLLYGEGSKAFTRLQYELARNSSDEFIFAWTDPDISLDGILARSHSAFTRFVCSDDIIETSFTRLETCSS